MIELYSHPFSSDSQKVLIALWEKQVDFTYRHMEEDDNSARLKALWPLAKFPALVDDRRVIVETAAIVEYVDRKFPDGPRLIAQGDDAVEMRMMESVFDAWVMTPMNAIVRVALRGEDVDASPITAASHATLDTIYGWLDARLAGRRWAAGDDFTLADCGAAPALFYADWLRPIPPEHATLLAYRDRLFARPSVARAIDEGRPYRHYFPVRMPEPAEPKEAIA